MTAVANVLNGAADLILRDGWVQGGYRGPNGERCLIRAVGDAAGAGDHPHWWSHPGYSAALVVVSDVIGSYLTSVWQDCPGRTKAEVVAALRAAAERAS